jgi:predicted NAD/FAD-binding protein
MPKPQKLRVAVVGGGVAGITAAYLLQQHHDVTLIEKNATIGGHTHTVLIPDGEDRGTPVDTGFIVLNDRTYPCFNRLLQQLQVPIQPSDMSFSYFSEDSGFQYASRDVNSLFAQRRNFFDPGFLRLLLEIVRFNRVASRELRQNRLDGLTLGAFLERFRFGPRFRDQYILPMAAAIWSSPDAEVADFPMATFARFFQNHGLLTVRDQPQWYVVKGGSHTYVKAFMARFSGTLQPAAPVAGIRRSQAAVTVRLADGSQASYDHVVIAAHADEAFRLLDDPSEDEKRLLGPWRYSTNRVVLHTDPGFMPSNPRAWASWNYTREAGAPPQAPVTLTYHMNRLQRLQTRQDYFVTLNPGRQIADRHAIKRLTYTHPMFTFATLETQSGLSRLVNRERTSYCGSYFGYGFHEDAVQAAVRVAESFGIAL